MTFLLLIQLNSNTNNKVNMAKISLEDQANIYRGILGDKYYDPASRLSDVASNKQNAQLTNIFKNIFGTDSSKITTDNNSNTIAPRTYTVKTGDNLWKIAKEHNIPLEQLIKLNPDKTKVIYTGDVLRLEPEKEVSNVNVREEWYKESQLNSENISAIQGYKHKSNYAIVDKKNKTFSIFDKNNNLLYQTDDIATGVSGDDYNTTTYYKPGTKVIDNFAGNMSTPAGITEIRATSNYHGYPSFIRSRVNNQNEINQVLQNGEYVPDDVASSLHVGNTKTGSNGCVRMSGKTLQDVSQFLGAGDRVYTLPEKEGSRFTLKGGKLNFTADNPYGNDEPGRISKSGKDMRFWDDYNTTIDKTYTPLQIQWTKTGNKEYDNNVRTYAQTIVNNKQALQQKFGLTSDEYNHLADLALGLAEQESKFGTSTRYKAKNAIPDWSLSAIKSVTRGNSGTRSYGLNQIKIKGDNANMQKIYSELGINDENISIAGYSALATMARLAYMYNSEVRGRNFKDANGGTINPYEALLYKWNGHGNRLTNGTATPNENVYLRNVRSYSGKFKLFERREYDKYKYGGRYSLEEV